MDWIFYQTERSLRRAKDERHASEEGAPLNASHAAAVEIDQAGDVFISYAS
jgi:hypothetical protein